MRIWKRVIIILPIIVTLLIIIVLCTYFFLPSSQLSKLLNLTFRRIQYEIVMSRVPKVLEVNATISLLNEGDQNRNKQIDTGDTVVYTYLIKNTTNKTFNMMTLKTNIDRKKINSIFNLKGTSSVIDDLITLQVPYITLTPNGEKTISFEANVNSSATDIVLKTRPTLISEKGEVLFQGQETTVIAKSVGKQSQEGSQLKVENNK